MCDTCRHLNHCLEPPQWTDWYEWSACSATCGKSKRTRNRECVEDICPNGKDCRGPSTQIQRCDMPCCKGNLSWVANAILHLQVLRN